MPIAESIPGIFQGVLGLGQAIFGGGRERRAEKKLEKMINNYQESPSIMDFYTKAMNQYNANPYTSASYNYAQNQIKGGTAQGIANLQDRKSGLAGIPALIRAQNESLMKAGANAEDRQAQALGQLGMATQLKDREDKYKFENMANLLSKKAGAGADMANAGISNLYGGLGSIMDYNMINKMYGNKGN